MKPDDVCWEAFGFPNPGFMPAWKPAEGLMKALAERKLAINMLEGRINWDNVFDEDQLKIFDLPIPLNNGQAWCGFFDAALSDVAKRYLNHIKLDLTDMQEFPDEDYMWTLEDLLLEAADGEEDDIIHLIKEDSYGYTVINGDLSPEWNLKWLIQRQKAINLLLYAPVPYRYDCIGGSTHNGEPSSPAESVAAAISEAEPDVGTGLPSSYVHNIYGPDHGWREGSYCCNVRITKKIYANLPEGFEPDGNLYMTLKVTGSDGSDESFAGGGRLTVGMNLLTADSNGVFIEFSGTDLTKNIKTPTKDHETSGGWTATQCMAYADYTSKFHFKGD